MQRKHIVKGRETHPPILFTAYFQESSKTLVGNIMAERRAECTSHPSLFGQILFSGSVNLKIPKK